MKKKKKSVDGYNNRLDKQKKGLMNQETVHQKNKNNNNNPN